MHLDLGKGETTANADLGVVLKGGAVDNWADVARHWAWGNDSSLRNRGGRQHQQHRASRDSFSQATPSLTTQYYGTFFLAEDLAPGKGQGLRGRGWLRILRGRASAQGVSSHLLVTSDTTGLLASWLVEPGLDVTLPELPELAATVDHVVVLHL